MKLYEIAFTPEIVYSKYPLDDKQLLHHTPLTTNNFDAFSNQTGLFGMQIYVQAHKKGWMNMYVT